MKKAVLGFLLGSVSIMLADTTSLQSILTNANGTQTTDFSGYNTGGFNQTTGLGTLTFVFNPGPGTYFFDVFFDHQLNLPFFNEFGTVNGAPVAGQSYEIGDSFASNIYPDVQAGGALPNTNSLAGTTDNFSNACVGAACNGDFSAAMGFSFTLAAGEEELITLNASHTNPGGFTLQDTHPVDGCDANGGNCVTPAALSLFISGSAVTQPACTGPDCNQPPPVPEPMSVVLFGTAAVILLGTMRRRLAAKA